VTAGIAMILTLLSFQGAKKQRQEMMRDIAQLQEQVYALEERIVKLESKPDPTGPLENQILAINAELKDQLRGVIDELGRMRASLDNIENRVTQLEESEKRVTIQTPGMPDDTAPTSVSGELLQQQFQQARLDFDRGKYAVAETGFRDLLTTFPDSPLASECKHYLGRALFEREKYREARDLFAEVAAGRSDFALQARLYEAQSYFHQGLFAKAVELLDNLILGHPDTQEAQLARRFLESNGLD